MAKNKGVLIVISGPSGAGKGTICKALLEKHKDIHLSVSATTREPRQGEVHGVNYYFLNKDEFLKKVEEETKVTIKEDEIEKIITIASLVEEEAELDEERDLISSVIYNRLEKGMKLEFCSTINYAWGEHLPQVLNKHLEIDSPYNTYKNLGLPVGPITNPGEKSIVAAVKPAKTDYLYFMLLYNQGGKHHFSTTGAEHEKVKKEEEAKAKAN